MWKRRTRRKKKHLWWHGHSPAFKGGGTFEFDSVFEMIAQFTAWSHQDVETKQKFIWFSFTGIAAIRGGKMNPDKRSVRFCRTWTCNLCLLHDRGTVFSSSVSCHCLFVPSSNVLINPERLHSGVVNMSAILNFTLELCLVFSCLALTVDLLCLRITTSLPAGPVRLHLHIKRCFHLHPESGSGFGSTCLTQTVCSLLVMRQ